MKLAVEPNTYFERFGLDQGVERAGKRGWEAACFPISMGPKDPMLDWSDKQFDEHYAQLRHTLQKQGLIVPYVWLTETDFAHFSPEIRQKICRQGVKAAKAMGAHSVAIRPATFAGTVLDAWERSKTVTLELAGCLREEADRQGIRIAFINNARRATKFCYGCRPQELLELCDAFDADVIIDPVNAYFAGERLDEIVSACGRRMIGFLIKDVELTFKTPHIPIAGALDYNGVLPALAQLPDNVYATMIFTDIFKRFKKPADLNESVFDCFETFIYHVGQCVVGKATKL